MDLAFLGLLGMVLTAYLRRQGAPLMPSSPSSRPSPPAYCSTAPGCAPLDDAKGGLLAPPPLRPRPTHRRLLRFSVASRTTPKLPAPSTLPRVYLRAAASPEPLLAEHATLHSPRAGASPGGGPSTLAAPARWPPLPARPPARAHLSLRLRGKPNTSLISLGISSTLSGRCSTAPSVALAA